MPRPTSTAGRATGRPGTSPGRSRDVETQLSAIEKDGGDGEVEFGHGSTLRVSSLDKVYFPDSGVTKGAVMRYYASVWPALAPHLKDRPLVLKRYPDGIGGPLFFQQNAGAHVPGAGRVEAVETVSEGRKPRIIGGDLATLLYTVQLGAIEVHPWLSRIGSIDFADRCLIDLDPPDDVPLSAVVSLAKDICRTAAGCGLPMATKTSGASGIHLVVPLPPRTTYETSLALAVLLSRAVVAQRPELATVERSIRARPAGTIYVDAMQNSRGKSMAAAYSLRPRAGAPVSIPLRGNELTGRLRIGAYTIRNVPARVLRLGDIWGEALAKVPSARTIQNAVKALTRVLEGADENESLAATKKRSSSGGRGVRTTAGKRRRPGA